MMKKQIGLSTVAVGIGAGVLAMSGAPALADSPTITASGGQCEGRWTTSSNTFRIRDNDLNDSDFCYVDFSFTSSSGVNSSGHGRVQNGQDVGGYRYYGVGNGGSKTVWWKVCKERQNDPDICSSIRSDTTS